MGVDTIGISLVQMLFELDTSDLSLGLIANRAVPYKIKDCNKLLKVSFNYCLNKSVAVK